MPKKIYKIRKIGTNLYLEKYNSMFSKYGETFVDRKSALRHIKEMRNNVYNPKHLTDESILELEIVLFEEVKADRLIFELDKINE